jgi:hypothetical protein
MGFVGSLKKKTFIWCVGDGEAAVASAQDIERAFKTLARWEERARVRGNREVQAAAKEIRELIESLTGMKAGKR